MIVAGSLLYVLILIALMYLLIKVPGWVLRAATRHPRRGGGFVRSLVKGALLAVGVSSLGVGPTLLAATRGGPASRVAGSLLGSALGQGWLAAKRRSTPAQGPYAAPAAAGPAGQLALPLGRLRRARRADTPAARAQAARADWAAHLTRTRIDSGATTAARTSARTRRGQQLALPLDSYWPEQQLIEGPGGQWMMKLPPGARKRPPRAGAPDPSEAGAAARTRPRPGTEARPGRRARQLSLPLGEFWPEDRLVMRRDGQWMLPLPPGARRRSPPTARTAGSSAATGTPAAGAASGTPVTRAPRALPGAPRATQLALPLGHNWPTPPTPRGGPRAARPPKAGPSPTAVPSKATPSKATPSKARPSPKMAPAPTAVPPPTTGPARSAGVGGTSDRVRLRPAARAPRPPRPPAPPLPPAGQSLPPSPPPTSATPRRRRPRPPDGSGAPQ